MNQVLPDAILTAITALSPFAAAIVNQTHWSVRTKQWVAFAVASVIAFVYMYVTGQIHTGIDVATVAGALFGLQQLVYKQLLHSVASKVELATSLGSGGGTVINTAVPTDSAGRQVVVVMPRTQQVAAPAPAPAVEPEPEPAPAPEVPISVVPVAEDVVEHVTGPVAVLGAGSAPADPSVAVATDERFVAETPARG